MASAQRGDIGRVAVASLNSHTPYCEAAAGGAATYTRQKIGCKNPRCLEFFKGKNTLSLEPPTTSKKFQQS